LKFDIKTHSTIGSQKEKREKQRREGMNETGGQNRGEKWKMREETKKRATISKSKN